jgi:ferredoxin
VDIKVHKTSSVLSDECHACLQCVAVCPEKDTLYISAARYKGVLKPLAYAMTICLLFVGGSLVGRLTGNWQTAISKNEYLFHIKHLDRPFYQHNRGRTPSYNKEAWLRMMRKIRETGNQRHP